jgi:hypothetical protein
LIFLYQKQKKEKGKKKKREREKMFQGARVNAEIKATSASINDLTQEIDKLDDQIQRAQKQLNLYRLKKPTLYGWEEDLRQRDLTQGQIDTCQEYLKGKTSSQVCQERLLEAKRNFATLEPGLNMISQRRGQLNAAVRNQRQCNEKLRGCHAKLEAFQSKIKPKPNFGANWAEWESR